jgi:hypothetical protein
MGMDENSNSKQTAALLTPQMPKIETKNAQEDLIVKSGIEAAAKRPKPTMGEQRVEPRLRWEILCIWAILKERLFFF